MCIPSGRNDNVLLVKSVIFRIWAKWYILGRTLSENLGSLGINVYSYINIRVYAYTCIILYACVIERGVQSNPPNLPSLATGLCRVHLFWKLNFGRGWKLRNQNALKLRCVKTSNMVLCLVHISAILYTYYYYYYKTGKLCTKMY